MLHDWVSLRLRRVNTDSNDGSSFDVASYELISDARFVHNATAHTKIYNIFLDIIKEWLTSIVHGAETSASLLKLLMSSRLTCTTLAGDNYKSCSNLAVNTKRNIEEFNTVDKTIQRLTSKSISFSTANVKAEPVHPIGDAFSAKWSCAQVPKTWTHLI